MNLLSSIRTRLYRAFRRLEMTNRSLRWGIALVATLLILVAATIVWRWYSSPERIYQNALTAISRQDWQSTRKNIKTLENTPNWKDHAKLLRGAYCLHTGHADEGLRVLMGIDFRGPLRQPALLYSGECFYKLKALTEALRVFRQVLAEDPNCASAHRWVAAIYYDLGANSLAIPHLTRLAALCPADFSPHRMLGLIASETLNHKIAAQHYREAMQRSPPDDLQTEIRFELIQALTADLDYRGALDLLDASKQTRGAVHVLRAKCYLGLGEHELAKTSLQLAEPDCLREAPFLSVSAELAAFHEQWVAVVEFASQALKFDPNNSEMQYMLARAQLKLGHHEESKRLTNQFLETKKLRERLAELTALADSQPKDAAVRDELKQICLTLGKPELAQMWQVAAESCRRAAE